MGHSFFQSAEFVCVVIVFFDEAWEDVFDGFVGVVAVLVREVVEDVQALLAGSACHQAETAAADHAAVGRAEVGSLH